MHRLTQTIECFVSRIRFGVFALGLAAAAALTGCGTAPMTFDSPQTAVTKLVGALRANDDAELKRIFGSDSDDLISSGDEVADQISRKEFVRLFDEQNRLVDEGEGKTLEIGRSGWPFPIPIVQDKSGWFFDTAAGLDELLSRRIGAQRTVRNRGGPRDRRCTKRVRRGGSRRRWMAGIRPAIRERTRQTQRPVLDDLAG